MDRAQRSPGLWKAGQQPEHDGVDQGEAEPHPHLPSPGGKSVGSG